VLGNLPAGGLIVPEKLFRWKPPVGNLFRIVMIIFFLFSSILLQMGEKCKDFSIARVHAGVYRNNS